MTRETSLEREFRKACDAPEGIAGGEAQPLLLDELRGDDGRLPGNVFQMIRQGKAKGPGRPKNAGNKRNQKIAEMVCQRGGDPVLFMTDIYAMPLDQLVEMLRIADGAREREERLLATIEAMEATMRALTARGTVDAEKVDKLTDLAEKLTGYASELKSRPGALALGALALQLQAARSTAEYVHGKQPISVDVKHKADVVLLVPGLNAPTDASSGEVARAVEQHGLDAIDVEGMRLLPPSHEEIEDEDLR